MTSSGEGFDLATVSRGTPGIAKGERRLTEGEFIAAAQAIIARGVSTPSRALKKGDLIFFDGCALNDLERRWLSRIPRLLRVWRVGPNTISTRVVDDDGKPTGRSTPLPRERCRDPRAGDFRMVDREYLVVPEELLAYAGGYERAAGRL
jgi:hypothetical protein